MSVFLKNRKHSLYDLKGSPWKLLGKVGYKLGKPLSPLDMKLKFTTKLYNNLRIQNWSNYENMKSCFYYITVNMHTHICSQKSKRAEHTHILTYY